MKRISILFLIFIVSCQNRQKFIQYYEDGSIKDEAYLLNGKPDGLVKTYYKSGKLETTINYSNGLPNGEYVYYYENGIVGLKHNFIDSLIDGKYIAYYDDGKLMEIRNYSLGKRSIGDTLFHKNGSISGVVRYENGEIFEGKYYKENGELSFLQTYEDGIFKIYEYDSNGEIILRRLYTIDVKIADYKDFIFFDSKEVSEILPYISREDKINLNKYYPNWQKEISTWEIKKLPR